jgi:hypothetical protein
VGKGDTFLGEPEDAKSGSHRHLNIVISNADTDSCYLVVPVTTWHEKDGKPIPRQDSSCILPKDCHPFLEHKSWVDFSRAKEMSFAEICKGVMSGLLIKKEDMPPDIILNIQRGAMTSKFLHGKFRSFFHYF